MSCQEEFCIILIQKDTYSEDIFGQMFLKNKGETRKYISLNATYNHIKKPRFLFLSVLKLYPVIPLLLWRRYISII